MDHNVNFFERLKVVFSSYMEKAKNVLFNIKNSKNFQKLAEKCKWKNISPHYQNAKRILANFTIKYPKTAAFIYVCLFCSFSIRFLDEPFASAGMNSEQDSLFYHLAELNPSVWWFVILIALWLIYMAIAGLSLTTDLFEKNLEKARCVLFILLTLSLSSLLTLVLNILIGRYPPEYMETMQIYGFSAFRFRVAEISFPSFATQSLWAVIVSFASFVPRFAKLLFTFALLMTLSLVLTAHCFISDAVMGAYIGIMMYHVAQWIVSDKNMPLITI